MPRKVNQEDVCIGNCPAAKDHLQHALEHLKNISKARNISPKTRIQTTKLVNMVESAQEYMKCNLYHFNQADSLPKRK